MNWRAIALWVGLGAAAALLAGALYGFASTLLAHQPRAATLGGAATAALLGGGLALSLCALGVPALLVVVLGWALLVRRFPALESSRARQVAAVSGLALLAAAVLLEAVPTTPGGGPFLAVLALAALVPPRLVTRRLGPGVFSR